MGFLMHRRAWAHILDLQPGTYRLHELQPTGIMEGAEFLGSLGGTITANDTLLLF